ncbi:MAG: flagellar filament outer layer protein FlaA [Treponema sp.]|nr:flagellar filament outer layer protein FlaA [Spirochaetia bacterium]MDY2839551.1 flagellar filament outer layer protein FlaA [Treponema sp.]MDY5123586.1 flagellar filament outer layer protein FlaA [Treponema sp.]
MKKVVALVAAVLASGFVFAQTSITDPNPEMIGQDSAMSALREVSVDKFEREGSWNVHISPDNGVITSRLFEGNPSMKEALEEDEGKEDEDTQVLGVRVDFFRRGVNSFTIMSGRPLPIEGTVKTISLWVCGRNQDHDMYVLVQDYFGSNFELYLGNLGFSGWKKLTCVVPPSPDGEHGIVQSSAYFGDKPGLKILGFRIDCNPMKARGSYYMYLDDLRAVTDLYDIQNRDEDDMADNW